MTFEKPKEPTIPENGTLNPIADMDSVLEKIPPIEGVFSPEEEVKEILALPTEKRKEALAEFRDKLARQVEAWKECRIILEESVEANPDISKEEMDKIVKEFSSNYGFPEERVKLAGSIIEDYLKKRRQVLEMREKYPDDIELINELTGLQFGEKDRDDFQLVTGPMYFEIHCSGENAGKIYNDSMEPPEGDFDLIGFAPRKNKKMLFIVVNKNSEKTNSYLYKQVLPHEREHAKNYGLFRERLFSEKPIRPSVRKKLGIGIGAFLKHIIMKKFFGDETGFYENLLTKQHSAASDPEEKKIFIEEYAKFVQEKALNMAKDEILALFKGGNHMDEHKVWMKCFGIGKPYDYLKEIRLYVREDIDVEWQKAVGKIIIKEYRRILENSVASFNRLRENGYRTEEVIAMLTDKRLAEWPKTAKRLLEEKEKREEKNN